MNNDWKFDCPAEEFETSILDDLNPEAIKVADLTEGEKRFINGLIRLIRPKKCVSFGIASGASDAVILNAIKDIPESHLIACDNMHNYYKDLSKKVGWAVFEYCDTSNYTLFTGVDPVEIVEKSIKGEIDFCLIDTAHIHPIESLNFLTILPFLKEEAVVVFHDISLFLFDYRNKYGATFAFNSIVADKIIPNINSTKPDGVRANIGALRVNSDTKKYIYNLFLFLAVEWQITLSPPLIIKFQKFILKYYGTESLELFNTGLLAQENIKKYKNVSK